MTGDQPAATDVNAVIDAHERSGYRLAVGGVETFVLDLGHGQPVVCLHGVPASSFLYRKLIVELAARFPRNRLRPAGAGTRGAARGLRLHLDRPWPVRIRRSKPSTWIGSIWWCTISVGRWGSSLQPRIRAESPRSRC